MAKKETMIKLVTSGGKKLEVTFKHAEKILLSRNNKNNLHKLDDNKFELTKNGLRKRVVKGDTQNSDK